MSRIANNPVNIPSGVDVKLDANLLAIKGAKGSLELPTKLVNINFAENVFTFSANDLTKESKALSGTFRSLVNNMVIGVTEGFEKLVLNGVGYRAKAAGKINLTLGFSHSIDYELPEGVSAETPSQTEVVIKGIDKQLVGQVVAELLF